MPHFRYTATDAVGSRVTGSYEAMTEKEVRIFLEKKSLTPVKVSRDWMKADISFGSPKVKQKDLVLFTKMFSVVTRAAIPADQSMRILQRQTDSKPLRKSLQKVIVKTEAGDGLAEAMREEPKVFDRMYTDMISAAETSGSMDVLLLRLADLLYRMNAIGAKIRSAMVYPIILSCVAILAVSALLVFVLPKFADFFAGMDLPWPTRVTLAMGDIVQNYWWALIGGTVLTIAIAKRAFKVPAIRRVRDRAFLKTPVVKDVIVKQGVARFTRTLSTLVASGVSVIEGLDLTASLTGNMIMEEAIRSARVSLTSGGQLSVALEESGAFPFLVTSMISVGEETGQLEHMLEEVAIFYEDDLNNAVDALIKLIEPVMLVVIGALVGLILASLYLPLFEMLQSVES